MAEGVRLRPVDEENLSSLLAVAMREAEPEKVMPPVDSPPGWTDVRKEAFLAFHRERFPGLDGPHRTVMHVVLADEEVVGMIRMTCHDEPGAMETGMWLGRSVRGRGIGSAAMRALLDEAAAAGATVVVAETTAGNQAAIATLRRHGGVLRHEGDAVHAEIPLRPGA